MPSKHKLLPVRASTALRALIDQAGPVNAATRALIILGAEEAGLDLAGVEREAATLLAAELAPGVADELRRVIGLRTNTSQHHQVALGDSTLAISTNGSVDPLGSVGWEV
jgi:hypothetical protein